MDDLDFDIDLVYAEIDEGHNDFYGVPDNEKDLIGVPLPYVKNWDNYNKKNK